MNPTLPIRVEEFLRTNIRSVWQLELLLLLKSSSEPLWATELASALYLTPEAVDGALTEFEKRGLISRSYVEPTAYVFSPITPELRLAVEETSKVYGQRKVAVINSIFSAPSQRQKELSDHN